MEGGNIIVKASKKHSFPHPLPIKILKLADSSLFCYVLLSLAVLWQHMISLGDFTCNVDTRHLSRGILIRKSKMLGNFVKVMNAGYFKSC